MPVVRQGAARIALATAAWAVLHSLLASSSAKTTIERRLGSRGRNGLYRAAYNAVAVATFILLVAFVRRQPGQTLYRVRGPAATLMRLGQFASSAYATWGVLQIGVGGMSGVPNLLALVAGRRQIGREPEGQTPAPSRFAGGVATRGSPFALTRQALNFFLLPLLWLNPLMTTRLAAFNAVTTLYAYLGSLNAERRLRRAYGPAYDEAYRQRGVPFFLPRLGNGRIDGTMMARRKALTRGSAGQARG